MTQNPSRTMMRMKMTKMRKRSCHVASSCAFAPSWRPSVSFDVLKVAGQPPRRDVAVVQMKESPQLDSLSGKLMIAEETTLLPDDLGSNTAQMVESPRREEPLQFSKAAFLHPPDSLGGNTSLNARTRWHGSDPSSPNAPVIGARYPLDVLAEDVPWQLGLASATDAADRLAGK